MLASNINDQIYKHLKQLIDLEQAGRIREVNICHNFTRHRGQELIEVEIRFRFDRQFRTAEIKGNLSEAYCCKDIKSIVDFADAVKNNKIRCTQADS